jgi:hypothetical protein
MHPPSHGRAGTHVEADLSLAGNVIHVTELANDGRDLKSAQALLAQFETMLANHVADRDRIRSELAAMK